MFFSIIQKGNNCLSYIQFVFSNSTFTLHNIVLSTKMMNEDDGELTYDNEECVIEVLMEFFDISEVDYEDMPALIPRQRQLDQRNIVIEIIYILLAPIC